MVRPREKGRPPEGFTLVELLVVLGVFSLVMALVVPAVQSSRENSRRLECASRLKQIMLATEAFASQHLHYPEYSSGGIDGQGVKHWNVCPFVEILPFIDQMDVFRRINRDRWFGSYDSYGSGQLYSGQNAEFVKLSIPLYQCPADRRHPGSCNYRANLGSGADWYTIPPPPAPDCFDPKNGNGAFQWMKQLYPQDFSDGLSNTVIYSERVVGDGNWSSYDPWRDYSQVGDAWPSCTAEQLTSTCRTIAGIADKHASFGGFTWLFASKAHTAYDHILPPNSLIPDCARDNHVEPSASNSAIAARSQHRGGVNTVLGDGSVRFVSENVAIDVWRALGSRNGRD